MDFPGARMIATNGIHMAVHEAGEGPAVLLLHGFPELAYSWRRQMRALADGGWRAIAPDLRGYGDTGPQGPPSAYSMRNLGADVLGLMDALEVGRAVVVGHDFGGALAWSLARDHAHRFYGVISLNTPYTRRGDHDLVEVMRLHRGETNYMVQFQSAGVGEAVLERDIEATFRGLMRRPPPLHAFRAAGPEVAALPMSLFVGGHPGLMGASILEDEELAVYVEAYRRTGFTGALSWYRNLHRNWLDSAGAADRIDLPALMISAADDFFLPRETTRGMEAFVPALDRAVIEDCGHWTQQEQPARTNALILDWLETRIRSRRQ